MNNLKLFLYIISCLFINTTFAAIYETVYECGFEDTENLSVWDLQTADKYLPVDAYFQGYKDYFFVGTATSYMGSKSLYVSSDNGITNSIMATSQSNRTASVVDLQVTLAPGNYTMDFVYRLKSSYVSLIVTADRLDFDSYFIDLVQNLKSTDDWETKHIEFTVTEEVNWFSFSFQFNTRNGGEIAEGFAIDNIVIKKETTILPAIAEMEEQGLVQLISDLDYTATGTWGDSKSVSIQIFDYLWFSSYVCKYNLNANDFLSITTAHPVVVVYKGEVQQPVEVLEENGINRFLFKTKEAGMYYVQITDVPSSGDAVYLFNIHRYGQLQSLSFGNTSHITSNLPESEIKNALQDLTITGMDAYGQDVNFSGLLYLTCWNVNMEEKKATFIPVFLPFEDFEFPLSTDVNNEISWSSATGIAETSSPFFSVTTQNLQITISNTAEKISIYNLTGQLITSGNGAGSYAVPQAGVYIVKAGGMVKKVIVNY
jgi:hypothetical protein